MRRAPTTTRKLTASLRPGVKWSEGRELEKQDLAGPVVERPPSKAVAMEAPRSVKFGAATVRKEMMGPAGIAP